MFEESPWTRQRIPPLSIIQELSLEGTSGSYLVLSLAQSSSSWTRLFRDWVKFWISPRMLVLQLLYATFSSIWVKGKQRKTTFAKITQNRLAILRKSFLVLEFTSQRQEHAEEFVLLQVPMPVGPYLWQLGGPNLCCHYGSWRKPVLCGRCPSSWQHIHCKCHPQPGSQHSDFLLPGSPAANHNTKIRQCLARQLWEYGRKGKLLESF